MKRRFLTSFILSCLIFGLIFWGYSRIFLDDVISPQIGDGEEASRVKNELLVLLLGVDTDGTRTDTMILGKANFDDGQIEMLAIPRDTRVEINGKADKINHAHVYGGPELSLQTVEELLDINIDYYIKVDYRAVMAIVDAIGGVEIDVPQRMVHNDPTDRPPLHIDLHPGMQKLDGQKAHDFLRFRGYANGDIGRVEAQQYFMKEFIRQTLRPRNILRIDKLVRTYYDYVDTNIPLDVLLKAAVNAKKLDMENIRGEMVPGFPKTIYEVPPHGRNPRNISFWIYDRQELDLIVQDMFREYIKGYIPIE